ncbi:AI-2E family transporter [Candidatus Sumerlaeota bacterium]|nr:AI-2E family transporter [Candidatus Sumerlaeota bacterium]
MTSTQTDQRLQTICLLTLSAIALAAALHWLSSVLIPFTLAIFLAIALSPVINFQVRRLRFPRPLAVLITILLVFLFSAVVGQVVLSSMRQLVANADIYQQRVEELLQETTSSPLLQRLGVDPESEINLVSLLPSGFISAALRAATNLSVEILSSGMLVMIFVLFLLIGGKTRSEPAPGVWGEIDTSVKQYVVTKIILSVTTGVLVGLIFAILGIDFALVFGFLAFLLNFIPTIGSIIATVLPIPVVLLTPEITWVGIALAIALPGAVQFLIGNIIEPKVMGDSLDLHPVTILLALMLWGILWGIVGMLLAVPIAAVMKILFQRLEVTRPIAQLMAGRLDKMGQRVS